MRMLSWRSVVTVLVVVSTVWAEDQPVVLPPATNCVNGIPGNPACVITPKARQEAKKAFQRGMKLQKDNKLENALDEFKKAADLAPRDVEYVTLRELVRQQLVYDHLRRGNAALANDQQVLAMGEFRAALNLDPSNDFARQRLNEAVSSPGEAPKKSPRIVEQSNEIRVVPKDQLQTFHFRGDSRLLLTQVASAYGVVATFDDSVVSRRVRFDVEDVDFYEAMRLAGHITKTFWAPLEAKQVLVAADSAENHRLYDRMALRTFFIPDIESPQELTDLVNVVRSLFEIKFVSSQPQNSTLIVRAPQNILDPATVFLENLGSGHPEVMLDVRVFEVSRTVVNNFGLQIPNQFNLYNIPIGALGLTLAGGQSIQALINQLIASGAINQANSAGLSALLAQLTGSSSASNILSQPLATFGGGLTLFGVSLGTLGATLSRNESALQSLQHVTVRASQNKDATVNIGSRYPIVNASFAPIFNTSAISSAIQGGSYVAPIPSFTYVDIGLDVKVKPVIHGDSDVSLTVEIKISALTGAGVNGIPVIGNREYTGSINVKNDQSAVVAGEISSTEQKSLSGVPGLGQIPVLNKAVASNTNEKDVDEMIVVITPHIISMADAPGTEIWMTGIK
jgi:general secretion pathway protein D